MISDYSYYVCDSYSSDCNTTLICLFSGMKFKHTIYRYPILQKMWLKEKAVKEALQQILGLRMVDLPLIGIISRLTHQKEIHLIKHAIWRTLERGGQVCLIFQLNVLLQCLFWGVR